MELKDKKYINNTGKLPGFYKGLVGDLKQLSSEEQAQAIQDWNSNLYNYNFDPAFKEKHDAATNVGDLKSVIQKDANVAGLKTADQLIKDFGTPNIPKQDTSTKISNKLTTSNIQTAASALPGFIGNVAGSWTNYESKDEILAKYHPVQANVAGIGFTKLSNNKNGKLPGFVGGSIGNVAGATASGASIGSVAGPWGAVIGGAVGLVGSTIGEIISGNKQRERERQVFNWVNRYNNGQRDYALSTAMQLNDQEEHGDQYSQSIFKHANGKLPGLVEGFIGGEPNAKVSNGEFIAREVIPGQFIGYRVPGPKNNKDGRLAHLEPEDYVISNKNGSSDIAASGDIIGAINHMITTGNPSYKCGKLPGHAEGWLGNGIPAILGSIASLGQYFDAKNNAPYYPRTYIANPYEKEALSTLAGLRANPYPIARELRNAEARSNRAIDIAGGLSGSQRTAARLANLNTTQNNIANLLSSVQQQNNAYKANYAQAAINAGQAARQARMAANQWDLDYYSKAHAARNKGIQTGIANMLAQIQQYQANEFKRRQFNETMDLYRADQKQRQDQFDWYRNTQANLPYYSLYNNIYGNPIKDNDVIEFDPYGARAYRKRNGLSIGG